MSEFKNEIWKPIINYEGFYEISNYGRVRSVDRTIYFKNGKGSRFYKGKILKLKYYNGYALVNLNKNKKMETLYVHNLVANHFLENPNKLPIINHKDGIKSNNCWTNLEFCTSKYNNEHANKNSLRKNNINGLLLHNKNNSIKIACYKNEKLLYIANCSRDLASWLIENNYIKNSNIESIARAIRKFSKNNKTYYGFTLKRLNIVESSFEEPSNIAIIKDGNILTILSTSNECAKWLLENHLINNACQRTIARAIRKALKENKSYHSFTFHKFNN